MSLESTNTASTQLLLERLDEFHTISQRLQSVVGDIVDLANSCELCPDDENRLLDSGAVRCCSRELRDTAGRLECQAELDAAHDAIRRISMGALRSADVFGAIDDYDDLVAGEMALAKPILDALPAGRRIAFVGAGSMPVTPVHINRLTGRDVLAIDRDVEAVEAASRLLQLASIDGVRVHCSEGTHAHLDGVGLMHVATMADDKAGIVEQGLNAGIDHFLVRAGRSMCRLFYEALEVGEVEALGLRLAGQTDPSPGIKCQTFLFQRA